VHNTQLTGPGDHRDAITCAELRQILEHDKRRRLLTIMLEKGISGDTDECKTAVEKYASFIRPLGYQRVLILGADAVGVWVFRDIKRDDQTSTEATRGEKAKQAEEAQGSQADAGPTRSK
jgi:hypothetical protein